MASQPQAPIQVAMQVRWPDDTSDQLAVFANQFAVHLFQGNAMFVFGQSPPPVFAGTAEEQAELVRKMGTLPVHVLARYMVPLETLRQIADALQKTVAVVDSQVAPPTMAPATTRARPPRRRPNK